MIAASIRVPSGDIHICSGSHKRRLLVGEGNFSFALEMIRKHDEKAAHTSENSLAHSIVATELKSAIHCADCDLIEMFSGLAISPPKTTPPAPLCENCASTLQRIEKLASKGAETKLGVDGTNLHKEFYNTKFSRIHWNCPQDRKNFKYQPLPAIIGSFFKSCSKLQHKNDRIHITLAQPKGKSSFYQGYIYNIARAASSSGYQLIKKRKFNSARYPGYSPFKTRKSQKAAVVDEGLREFVFQKIGEAAFNKAKIASRTKEMRYPIYTLTKKIAETSEKKCLIVEKAFYGVRRTCYDCSSDEDSSDYES